MGTVIDLFLWENGIWVAGIGIWPLGMGNEVLKNGNGIEVMRVDSQFFHVLSVLKYNFDPCLVSLIMIFVVNYIIHSTTCEQAYSGARNSGFSDYACGFRYMLHLTLSIYLKGKAQPLLSHGAHTRWLKRS
jgi:hypothetical protein